MALGLLKYDALFASDINFMATGTTDVVTARAGKSFVAVAVYIVCKTATGSEVSVSPVFKVGNNASTYNNVITAYTFNSGSAGAWEMAKNDVNLPLLSGLVVDMDNPLMVNITTAATGPDTFTGDVVVLGWWLNY